MAYSDLKKLKKEEIKDITKVEVDNLIVGGDLFALASYEFFKNKFADENTKILTKEMLTKESTSFLGPNILRGEENVSYLKNVFEHAEIVEKTETPKFYKDMKFKPFGGRGKSEKLMWGEEFFTTAAADYSLEKIFPFVSDDEFYTKAKEDQIDLIYTKIFKDDDTWVIECSNGTQIFAKKLVWSESPWKFYEESIAKEKLSNEFIEFVESTKTPCALHVKLEFDKEITKQDETLLIPLSYTHDWGHFICEFSKSESENSPQTGHFLTFIDVNDTNEEDISKKIRLLKRNLEKIYPHFKDINAREFIVLTENTHSLEFDDSFFLEGQPYLKNAYFISSSAPFYYENKSDDSDADSLDCLTHLSRGLKVLLQFKNLLS
ncbi:hypothetical protein [Halobacteriovorax sp.]|uniref:hypothetical protein n=1 Tax=Halobacteriovorax sp. TaxID=2020862 RepID=UPI003564ED8B